jgi:beta-phosphoglucomutase-like phosphatase (HAD superfamily)
VPSVAAPNRTGVRRRGSTAANSARLGIAPRQELLEPPPDHRPIDLESVSADWQRAFDAAGSALRAATGSLPPAELHTRQRALVDEVGATAVALHALATGGGQPAPWLSPTPVTNAMLGLPATVRACLFDVEGVLTDSSRLHAWAWGEVFDDFLSRLGEATGWHVVPFDRAADYRTYVEGRSRLEGVHAFLESRGVHVPEGHPDEWSDADTAHNLARRKGMLLETRLHEQDVVTALPGARRYLEATRRAGVARGVVYESANTFPILERAELAPLIDAHVDAAVISAEGLRSRPAPDLLLAACRRLEVLPKYAVTFTNTPAGVVAGRRAGILTIGVGDAAQCELLEEFGADRVVPSLSSVLDRRLLET